MIKLLLCQRSESGEGGEGGGKTNKSQAPRNINRKQSGLDVGQSRFHPSNIRPKKVTFKAVGVFLEGRITSVSTVADTLEVKVSIITS